MTLSPQLGEYANAWAKEDGITHPVLLDLGNGVARDYGLVFRFSDELKDVYTGTFKIDLTRFNGDESWELAIPATYVVSQDGSVVYASADPDYTTRPEPSEVLDAIPAS